MEHEQLFTATKWDILKILEQGPRSPLELSKVLHSSLANVSQQLRLLEMAGLVKTSKVSNRDKDMPRVLYRLAGNLSYMIATSDNFVDKKFLQLSECNKIILRIWFLDDQNLRYALEKAFWAIEPHLASVELLSYLGFENGVPVLGYRSSVALPNEVKTGGALARVLLQRIKDEKTSGHELFRRGNDA